MKFLISTILVIFLASCSSGGGSSDSSSSTPATPSPNSPIAGSQFGSIPTSQLYRSLCQIPGGGAMAYYLYFTKTGADTLDIEQDTFLNASGCSGTILFSEKQSYQFTSFSVNTLDSSLEDITTQLSGIYLRIFDSATLISYNNASTYTYSDWVLTQPKDISCKEYQTGVPARQCSGVVGSYTFKFVNSGTPTVIFGGLQFQ